MLILSFPLLEGHHANITRELLLNRFSQECKYIISLGGCATKDLRLLLAERCLLSTFYKGVTCLISAVTAAREGWEEARFC